MNNVVMMFNKKPVVAILSVTNIDTGNVVLQRNYTCKKIAMHDALVIDTTPSGRLESSLEYIK